MLPSRALPPVTSATTSPPLALAPVAVRPAPAPLALALASPGVAARAALARAALAPLAPGSDAYRTAYRVALDLSLADVAQRMAAGASPAYVAAYVRQAGAVGMGLSMRIEDMAAPGTFAEAVFLLLAA